MIISRFRNIVREWVLKIKYLLFTKIYGMQIDKTA